MKQIKALKNKKVINPETRKELPPSGIYVQKVSQYWKNREKDGDVTISDMKIKKTKKENN